MGNRVNCVRATRYWLLIIITIISVALNFSGCESGNTPPTLEEQPTPAKYTAEPIFNLNPNDNTPLAGVLHVATDTDTRVSLQIANNTGSWLIQFDEFAKQHSLPVLGFKPGQTHTITIHLFNRDSVQPDAEHTLTVNTAPLPDGFPTLTVHSTPSQMEPGLTLFNAIPQNGNIDVGAMLFVVDTQGNVVWYLQGQRFSDARLLDNGNLLFVQMDHIVEMDWLGNIVRDWQTGARPLIRQQTIRIDTASVHHEVFPMRNGNFLTLSIETRDYDNYWVDAWDLELPKMPALVAGDVIVEFTPDGSIVNQWSLLDILDPYRIGYGSLGNYWDSFFNKETKDWSHANAVIHDPADDSIIVSVRHQDAVVKFNRQDGTLKWILGPHNHWDLNRFGQFLLTPLNNQQYFFSYHQHSPMVMPNGNILIYDNGNYRASPGEPTLPMEENFSRAAEYKINEQNKQVELVWEYGQFAANRYYCFALGDADFMPETGNVLITHGNITDVNEKMSGRIIEVTRADPPVEVFNLLISDSSADPTKGWRIYRSERITGFY